MNKKLFFYLSLVILGGIIVIGVGLFHSLIKRGWDKSPSLSIVFGLSAIRSG